MTHPRTRGIDQRGNSYDRRARKEWLLSSAAGFGGDTVKVACWECGTMVDYEGLYVDRIVPGEGGGRYVRGNIRLALRPMQPPTRGAPIAGDYGRAPRCGPVRAR